MTNDISIYINGTTVLVDSADIDSRTLIQHCEMLAVSIPRSCYHDQLSIAGNRRICLVELGSSAKPVIACSAELSAGLEVFTNSELVMQARESVLEFLSINHPPDCPICDQGGECDLQDIAHRFGSDSSRFIYDKRTSADKYFGVFVKGIMTRCIHCTRCVRFADEVLGSPIFGTLGRGYNTEIGYYISDHAYDTQLIGNVVDLCPVGALTSKLYAFTARPWELVSTESIDVLDSLCSNIRLDTRGAELMRILPRQNALLNNEWITDKIRFSIRGLKNNRLVMPVLHNRTCSWATAYSAVKLAYDTVLSQRNGSTDSVYFFAGHLVDACTLFFYRYFGNLMCIDQLNIHANTDIDLRTYYIMSDTEPSFHDSNVFLLLGINMKSESPILNVRIQNNVFNNENDVKIGYIGTNILSTYPVLHIGLSSASVITLFYGKSFISYYLVRDIAKSICVTGEGSAIGGDRRVLSHALQNLATHTSFVSLYPSDITANDLGVLPTYRARTRYVVQSPCHFVYSIGSDTWTKRSACADSFYTVYQGHNVDTERAVYDVLLPCSAFTEHNGSYVNCFGMVQRTIPAQHALGMAEMSELVTYTLLRYLVGSTASFHDLLSLYTAYFPSNLNYINDLEVSNELVCEVCDNVFITASVYVSFVRDYYGTDVISRNSAYETTLLS